MKCAVCQRLRRTEAFATPEEYRAALARLTAEPYEVLARDSFEVRFRCARCGTVWRLAEPDFPLRGFLLEAIS